MRACHRCGRELPAGVKIARTDGCSSCHSDLKVCLNCRLHDPGANNQCREPQAEWVTDKDKANFCEFFDPGTSASTGGRAGAAPEAERARDAFAALFSRKP